MANNRVTNLFLKMKQAGVSQGALANDLGVDQATVSRIASGLTKPNAKIRKQLCKRFSCGEELFAPAVVVPKPNNLYAYLESSGRCHARLAGKAGLSEVRLLRVMHGHDVATPDEERAICRALQVRDVETLFPVGRL